MVPILKQTEGGTRMRQQKKRLCLRQPKIPSINLGRGLFAGGESIMVNFRAGARLPGGGELVPNPAGRGCIVGGKDGR